jgi:hypothetical protein
MSGLKLLTKHTGLQVTDEQIHAAITKFKAEFPHNSQLGSTADTQLAKDVKDFLSSQKTFTATIPSGTAETRLATSLGCAESIAVVIIDVVFLFFSFAGLDIPDEGAITNDVVGPIGEAVEQSLPQWQTLIQAVVDAQGITEQAQAIWSILSKAYTVGMFSTIASAIESSVPWYDWVIAGVAAVAQIAALVLTDGASFIAELVLAATQLAWVVSAAVAANKACN